MDKLDFIKLPVKTELDEFQALFEASFRNSTPLLNEVLAYIKKRNGKMMRPLLVMLMAKLFKGSVMPSTLHAALSLELLHTASLVHDDVVDESNERRGQSSVNALYDNKVSILVGDYMLATSLLHASNTNHIELVNLISKLGQTLSEGELIQLANTSNEAFSEDIYFEVIRKKTAALFSVCAESGAVSVGATEEEIALAAQFGETLGIAFQIKDDIFDYYDNPEVGKPSGNDMAEGKLTLPALYVLNTYKDAAMSALAMRIRMLKATKEEITGFIAYVKQHGGIEYAREVMQSYRDKALALLPKKADEAVLASLSAYIDYVVERDK